MIAKIHHGEMLATTGIASVRALSAASTKAPPPPVATSVKAKATALTPATPPAPRTTAPVTRRPHVRVASSAAIAASPTQAIALPSGTRSRPLSAISREALSSVPAKTGTSTTTQVAE
jgi:hypothetical protein